MVSTINKNKAPTNTVKNRKSPVKKTNSQGYKGWLFVIGIFVSLYFVCHFFFSKNDDSRSYGTTKAFGVKTPGGYPILGIDLSYFQEDVNWAAIKSAQSNDFKIGFVYIKATEGITRQDKKFNYNWKMAKTVHIPRGAYHFFIASRDGKQQAANFIKMVQLQSGDLPPVLDIEHVRHTSHENMRKEVKDWLEMVEDAYGIRPIIYTYTSFYKDYLGKEFDKYPLWIAHYDNLDLPSISRSWQFWQYSEEGKIKSLKGHFDMNLYNGDSADFEQLRMK